MHTALVLLALATNAIAEGVTSAYAPSQSPPPGCSPNYDGMFLISPVNATTKRDLGERNTKLGIKLRGGILKDPEGRTGYIASNSQFQFDDPPQAGAIWTAGFTVCQNGSLALGNDVLWYRCLSGDFFNLYFRNPLNAGQCIQSLILAKPINGSGPAAVPASFSTEKFTTPKSSMPGTPHGLPSSSTTSSTRNGSGRASTTQKPGAGQGTAASSASVSSTSSGNLADAISARGQILGAAAGLAALVMI